jgi:chaperonin GroES
MAFQPLGARVLISRKEQEEKTTGGLIIPEVAKEKPSEGTVVAVGQGTRKDSGELIPLIVQPGDTVLFGKWSGTEIQIDGSGSNLLIVNETDILGIVS